GQGSLHELLRAAERADRSARQLLFLEAPEDPDAQRAIVEEANRWAEKMNRQRRASTPADGWTRLVLLFDQAATLQWMKLDEEERVELESQAGAHFWPRRWNREGLRQTFDSLQMIYPDLRA